MRASPAAAAYIQPHYRHYLDSLKVTRNIHTGSFWACLLVRKWLKLLKLWMKYCKSSFLPSSTTMEHSHQPQKACSSQSDPSAAKSSPWSPAHLPLPTFWRLYLNGLLVTKAPLTQSTNQKSRDVLWQHWPDVVLPSQASLCIPQAW